jgi:hypothetical protein
MGESNCLLTVYRATPRGDGVALNERQQHTQQRKSIGTRLGKHPNRGL